MMNNVILCILVGTVFAMTYAKDTVDPVWVKEFESIIYRGIKKIDAFTCSYMCTGIYNHCKTNSKSDNNKCLSVKAACTKNCNLYKKLQKEGKVGA